VGHAAGTGCARRKPRRRVGAGEHGDRAARRCREDRRRIDLGPGRRRTTRRGRPPIPTSISTRSRSPAVATVSGNFRLTGDDASSDIRHIVLDFGNASFPVLEGQTIGILAPGLDAHGKPHHVRLYSVASPRDGERPKYNNLSLTVKRVTEDHEGKAARRRLELPVRPEEGRQGQCRRPLRHQLPDAQPPRQQPADDLHRHRLGADARHDRAPPPQVRRRRGQRQADALLRRPQRRRTALLRPADQAAQGIHRHQLRLLARAGRAQALRAGPAARARRRRHPPAQGRKHLRLSVRPQGHGKGRRGSLHRSLPRQRPRLEALRPQLLQQGRYHVETY
jgi:hypothetical protein